MPPETPRHRIDRRAFVAAGSGFAAAVAAPPLVTHAVGRARHSFQLAPRETEFEFSAGSPTKAVFSYAEQGPAPTLRVRQGEHIRVLLRNDLAEPTTVHWHGIRLPNSADGVPFLTQPYVYKGDTFVYAFSPPDAGTYWYHPHCNSLVQMSRGLGGLLIVEEARDPGFDADLALNLRDWRLGPDGQFTDFYAVRSAARAGTHGTLRTANWRQGPTFDVPSGGLVRVRLAATDVTRIYRLGIDGAPALVVARDGNPVGMPHAIEGEVVAPGQRLDLVVLMPEEEGREVEVRDHSGQAMAVLARLRSIGASRKRDAREVRPLPANPVRAPDLAAATAIELELTATAERVAKSPYCGDLGYSFWALNGKPWPGASPDPLAPLAELRLGRSYLLRLHNRTPHPHPIHLHGMTFLQLRSDRRALPRQWTDTSLVLPDERVEVAFVADNPGDWLLHCHVIEHQETGMTGFVRVS